MSSYKSQPQNTTDTYNLTQIDAIYIESSVSFEVNLKQIATPSSILHTMYIFHDEDFLLINYSIDYEGKDISLRFKDINRIFTFKNSSQIFF